MTLSLQICSTSLKTAAMSDCLPQEVITNILLRLPAKSLVVCTSVCKSWRSMIKDSSFISAHLSRTIDFNNHHDTHLLLLHRFYTIWSEKVSVHGLKQEVYSLHYDNNDFSDCCEIGFQSPIADREMCSEFFRVVGVCNGLVCLADDFERYGENFLLWNPSKRKLVSLPKPGITVQTVGGYAKHGFAFDVVTNDYKVVRVVEDQYGWEDEETENRIFVEVNSLAAGSWSSRRIVDPQWSVFGHSPQAFVNGALHWDVRSKASSERRYFIVAFDVGSELLREIMMPESLDWDSFRPGFGDLSLQLTVSGDGKSLALFLRYHDEYSDPSLLDVWVMKEYCVEESWTKLITLRPQGMKQFLAEEKKRQVDYVERKLYSAPGCAAHPGDLTVHSPVPGPTRRLTGDLAVQFPGFESPIADGDMCNESFRVVGICNGLVCLADDLNRYGYKFLIWNPSIRKLVTLPKPGLRYETVGGYDAFDGFAFDVITNDYKVVRLVQDQYGWGSDEDENQTFVEVYSLAAGSWSNPRHADPKFLLCGQRSPQAFVNGALHWDAHGFESSLLCNFILAFDVGSELFRKIMMPKSWDWDSLSAGNLTLRLSVSGDGKSLAMFSRYTSDTNTSFLDVWVMKEYCVEESWTELITLCPECPERSLLPSALCFRKKLKRN
ncbi:hypothetical protein ACLB2K_027371 [Fragaria x ananassa]